MGKALDGDDGGLELMGEIVDEILTEHLNAVQLGGHVVEGALKDTEIRMLVEGLLDLDLEIPLGDAFGGVDHLVQRQKHPLGKDGRCGCADQGAGDQGGGNGQDGIEGAERGEEKDQ